MANQFDEDEARRVIRQYNLLRVKSHLPPISPQDEIDRMREAIEREAQERHDFIYTLHPLRRRMHEKLLAHQRRVRCDPDWRPTGVLSGGGMAFWYYVNSRMKRLYRCMKYKARKQEFG